MDSHTQDGSSDSALDSPAVSKKSRIVRRVIRAVLVVAVLVALAIMLKKLNPHALWAALRSANPVLVALACATAVGQLGCRAVAWNMVLSPVTRLAYGRAFRYLVHTAAASALVPGRPGEALRVWLLKRDRGVPVPTGAAIAVVEKVLDAVAMLLILAPIHWLLPGLPSWVGRALLILTVAAVTALVVVAVLARRSRLPRWFASFQAGLGVFRRPAWVGLIMLVLLAAWLCDLGCIALVMRAVGLKIAPSAGLLVLLAVNAAILVPVLPASLGAFELAAVAALGGLGVAPAPALAFALLYHLAQVLPVALLAIIDSGLVAGLRK